MSEPRGEPLIRGSNDMTHYRRSLLLNLEPKSGLANPRT